MSKLGDICEVCGALLTEAEVEKLNLDIDFVEHGEPAHLIRSRPLRMTDAVALDFALGLGTELCT